LELKFSYYCKLLELAEGSQIDISFGVDNSALIFDSNKIYR